MFCVSRFLPLPLFPGQESRKFKFTINTPMAGRAARGSLSECQMLGRPDQPRGPDLPPAVRLPQSPFSGTSFPTGCACTPTLRRTTPLMREDSLRVSTGQALPLPKQAPLGSAGRFSVQPPNFDSGT